jgi:hypothetical protein
MSNATDFYRHGVTLCTEAVCAEEQQRDEDAFALYMSCLEAFQRALECKVKWLLCYDVAMVYMCLFLVERDPTNVTAIRGAMMRPLERAERLKVLLEWKRVDADTKKDDDSEEGSESLLDRVARLFLGSPERAVEKSRTFKLPSINNSNNNNSNNKPSSSAVVGPSLKQTTQPQTSSRQALSSSQQQKQQQQQQKQQQQQPNSYPELKGIDKDMQRKVNRSYRCNLSRP